MRTSTQSWPHGDNAHTGCATQRPDFNGKALLEHRSLRPWVTSLDFRPGWPLSLKSCRCLALEIPTCIFLCPEPLDFRPGWPLSLKPCRCLALDIPTYIFLCPGPLALHPPGPGPGILEKKRPSKPTTKSSRRVRFLTFLGRGGEIGTMGCQRARWI